MDQTCFISISFKNDPLKPNLLANADLHLETTGHGWVTIKAFQIWKSEYPCERLKGLKVKIMPPSTKSKQDFKPYQFAHWSEESDWFSIEKQIWEKYVDFCDKNQREPLNR